MNLKRISIITLTKNNLDELILTINSIIQQKINVLIELIIVDGSVNKKLLIQTLKSFEEIFYQKNILLKYINSYEKNIHGIYPSMNLAMDNLKSDYLIFMNSGDLFYNSSSNLLKFYNGSAWVPITADTDALAKVSSNDTTAGFLNGKLVAGSNISFTEGSDGGNETLTIAGSGASLDDATALAIALG